MTGNRLRGCWEHDFGWQAKRLGSTFPKSRCSQHSEGFPATRSASRVAIGSRELRLASAFGGMIGGTYQTTLAECGAKAAFMADISSPSPTILRFTDFRIRLDNLAPSNFRNQTPGPGKPVRFGKKFPVRFGIRRARELRRNLHHAAGRRSQLPDVAVIPGPCYIGLYLHLAKCLAKALHVRQPEQ